MVVGRKPFNSRLRGKKPRWWARQDSNLQPDRYERPALTLELQAPAAMRVGGLPWPADVLKLPFSFALRACRSWQGEFNEDPDARRRRGPGALFGRRTRSSGPVRLRRGGVPCDHLERVGLWGNPRRCR